MALLSDDSSGAVRHRKAPSHRSKQQSEIANHSDADDHAAAHSRARAAAHAHESLATSAAVAPPISPALSSPSTLYARLKSYLPTWASFTFIVFPNDDDHRRRSQLDYNNNSIIYLYGEAYDIKDFALKHPGGSVVLQQVIGQDCTDYFGGSHPPALVQQAIDVSKGKEPRGYFKGIHRRKASLQPYQRTVLQREFDEIVAKLEAEGMFEPTPGFYAIKAVWQAIMLAVVIALLWAAHTAYQREQSVVDNHPVAMPSLLNSSYTQWNNTALLAQSAQPTLPSLPITAPSSPLSFLSSLIPLHSTLLFVAASLMLGMFWQQMAFLGHDAGHNQVTGRLRGDFVYSWLVTALFGVSGAWWRRSHNVHHVHTNSIECDPDIQHLPFFAIDRGLLGRFFSTYHQKMFELDTMAKVMVSYQHYLYYPLMAIARTNLYAQSLFLCLNKKVLVPNRKHELAALAVFWMLYSALLYSLPNVYIRTIFHWISHAVVGLIHVQITLSHFAMPAHHGPKPEVKDRTGDEFFFGQFETTMNVECPRWFDWFHGGLQFQIEHHLLPRLPRKNLRYARDRYIRPFAAKHGLPYHCYHFLEANQVVYRQLKTQAMEMRKIKANDSAAKRGDSLLWQGMMAEG